MNNTINKGDKFTIPQGFKPATMAKMIASKYGCDPNDFQLSGKQLVYIPKKRKAVAKPKNMTVEEYYRTIVLKLNPKLETKSKEFQDEEWRPVQNLGRYFGGEVNFGLYYEVSNEGRLKTIDLKDAEKSSISYGYDAPTRQAMQFHLNAYDSQGNPQKTCPDVKYIVADAFLEPHDTKEYIVIHIDGDYHNNKVNNLMWVKR